MKILRVKYVFLVRVVFLLYRLKRWISIYQEYPKGWSVNEAKTKISLSLKFKDFATPMKIASEIGSMADEQWHHPELEIGFGHLDIHVWTHKIDGLVESDFIFGGKVDEIIKNSSRIN